jgi:RHS repeat-associated protein
MLMPGQKMLAVQDVNGNPQYVPAHGSEGDYRYGFNGMEKDDEVKGEGNSYTTEFRQYDPRIGRWLSLDPLMSKFPWMSPYVAFDNNPIYYTDPYGLESGTKVEGGDDGEPVIKGSGSESDDNGGVSNSPSPVSDSDKAGFNAMMKLIDPGSDPLDKGANYDKLKDANYYLSNEDLTELINNSSSSFIKANKKELLQIKNINVVDGIMTISTKDNAKIEIEGTGTDGKPHSLYISQGAKVDMTGLTIKSVTTIGKASANANAKTVTLTYLQVTGSVKFSNLQGDYSVTLYKETFTTTIETFTNIGDKGDWSYKYVKVASVLHNSGVGGFYKAMSMGANTKQKTTWK